MSGYVLRAVPDEVKARSGGSKRKPYGRRADDKDDLVDEPMIPDEPVPEPPGPGRPLPGQPGSQQPVPDDEEEDPDEDPEDDGEEPPPEDEPLDPGAPDPTVEAQATQEWSGDVDETGDETDPAATPWSFTGQGGEEAWLDRAPDGTVTGWVRDADGSVYRYSDPNAWALDVDDAGMTATGETAPADGEDPEMPPTPQSASAPGPMAGKSLLSAGYVLAVRAVGTVG